MPIIFNTPGLVMILATYGIAFGLCQRIGATGAGPLMIIAAPLCIAADLAFRWYQPRQRWFHPDGGGNLFFIPVWILGIIWLILGIARTINGESPVPMDEP